MLNSKFCLMAFTLLLIAHTAPAADNWPDWRGPTCDGHSSATGLPLTWSETENVVWKTAIHDEGHSSPVVWGDQVWFTTANKRGATLYAVCVDLKTGKIIYDIPVFEPEKPQRINGNNTYATPSPVIEEGRVYVHFGTFGTACIDAKTGDVLWKRTDLNCEHMQGPGSSPFIYKDLLVLHLEGTDVQFITALNKKTGDSVWRYDRPRDLYESMKTLAYRKSYQTPILVEVDGETQLISNGALMVTGHKPDTGEVIWQVLYGEDNSIGRVVSGFGLYFVNCGGPPNQSQLWAVRHGGKGDVTDSHVAWKMTKDVPLESSPVLVDDLLYTVSDGGVLICTQAETGGEVWQEKLSGRYGASPLYVDGRIYFSNKEGKTTVIEPGRAFHALAENQLDGELWSSPAVSGKSLILRTKTHLYRIEKK
ncbi:MAG: PQQ-binding-like beta-propeller repeat protein [Candidatus Hinthialibacter antarcticus]|nr:PQQ-binding-like beta-propeller repeat protein [Candidatus Hinthialibacter antarcticus]